MLELKDIVLKKGDIVYYTNSCGERSIISVNEFDGFTLKKFEGSVWVVTKVERPVKYETIYEAPKQILDKEEKAYLEAVLKPYQKWLIVITKLRKYDNSEYLKIAIGAVGLIEFPQFEKDTMYKGMELNKEYTLDKLGLFKESK